MVLLGGNQWFDFKNVQFWEFILELVLRLLLRELGGEIWDLVW